MQGRPGGGYHYHVSKTVCVVKEFRSRIQSPVLAMAVYVAVHLRGPRSFFRRNCATGRFKTRKFQVQVRQCDGVYLRDRCAAMLAILLLILGSGSLMCLGQIVVLDDSRLELGVGQCVLILWESCGSDRLSFKLSNSIYRNYPKDLDINDPDAGPDFNTSLPLKILIHGYGGGVEFYNPTSTIREAYLEKGGYNVLSVHWAQLSERPCYPLAVINTWYVARCTAQLLQTMENRYPGFDTQTAHVIGFSMGAHIAAYTSDEMFNALGRRFARITGLDPAWPLFNTIRGSPTVYLDSSDAHFVDIIHTNAGFFGKTESTGHQDFYVNGGSYQKPCIGNGYPNVCSHLMAGTYFAESIITGPGKGFWSFQCPSYKHYVDGQCSEGERQDTERALMGEYTTTDAHGTFIVHTRNIPPYALGHGTSTE